jgi:hypothetical protein
LARIASFRVSYLIHEWFLGRRVQRGTPLRECRSSQVSHSGETSSSITQDEPSGLPVWLDEGTYRRDILPLLSKFTVKSIRLRLGVSHPYATLIRRGMTIPILRRWLPLADLVGYRAQTLKSRPIFQLHLINQLLTVQEQALRK